MRKKGKFHGSLLSAVMILVILFTALGEKGISAKAETSEKEEVKEQIEEKGTGSGMLIFLKRM